MVASASWPSPAVVTSQPRPRRRTSSTRRDAALSSTNKIFAPATRPPASAASRHRKREEEPAAFADFPHDPEIAAVHLHELLSQRQAQSRSFGLAREAVALDLLELEKDPLLVFR